jgi:hypothetical protein
LTPDELNSPLAGNRFDSPSGNYRVVYFATSLRACFGETLARFRPDTSLAALVRADWEQQGFLPPGELPADWRHRRLAVRVTALEDAVFLDVESQSTRTALWGMPNLRAVIATYGAVELDVPTIRGGDRRITRLISHWAWTRLDEDGAPMYAGIRYLSRLDTQWECWAFFERTATEELERRSITRTMADLQEVADLWDLRVF